MKVVTRQLDLMLLLIVVGAFTFTSSQRLSTVPVPDLADEPFMLQTPYEVLYEGKFAQGMYRFLGGNIENTWRSLEPGCLLMLSGVFKVFGYGLLQARAFNLAAAAGILVILFFIGRRLVNWKAGLAASVLLSSDLTFLERSRMVRTDFAPAMFGLLAFYLYQVAEERNSWRFYVASGLAAGVGVLCHPNILYLVGAIILLILLRRGSRAPSINRLFQFSGAFLAVLSYTIVTCLADYTNLRLQYRDDEVHFGMLSGWTWWHNIVSEADRYTAWYSGVGLTFANLPLTLTHLFQAAAIVGLFYLVFRAVTLSRSFEDSRTRILSVTLIAALFFALVSRKTIFYLVHIEPWLALCAGVVLSDLIDAFRRFRSSPRFVHAVYGMCVTVGVAALLVYGFLLARQSRRFVREVRNPELATFEEFKEVIRSVVPNGVCPVSVRAPVIWLAFPESDRCFATIEKRMLGSVDISGKEYALVTKEKGPDNWARSLIAGQHLVARLMDSPYGDLSVYYTGNNPELLKLPATRYQFFGRWRGHASYGIAATSPEVWPVGPESTSTEMGVTGLAVTPYAVEGAGFVDLWSIALRPETIYLLQVDTISFSNDWEIVVEDAGSGRLLKQIAAVDWVGHEKIDAVFRTYDDNRVKLWARNTGGAPKPFYISAIKIREVTPLPSLD